ncbi:MAG: PQQ-binding-like beta-propeller repeat protein [Planctomycetales bacterium]|nr:PQQ-binding-like beta-propeller repeat protein [Planctomycetales bacterium]
MSPVLGDDWPFFRGPQHDGISRESEWQAVWPKSGPKIAWRKELGIGASSFAVVGNRVLTMGSQDDHDILWCLSAEDGEVLWKFRYVCEFIDHNFEGGTLSTPTIDGTFVYSLSYDGQVHCVRLDSGELVWRKHLVDDFQGRRSSWDYAASPLVVGDLIIFDTGGDGLSTVALNKLTGEKVWGEGDDHAGYSTPIPFVHQDTPGVLVFKARALVANHLTTGRELWRINWRTKYDVNASCPTVVGDYLFVSSGYGGRRARGAAFRLGGAEPEQLWVNDDIETKMNSAIVYEGHIYCVSERAGGQLMCVDFQTGKTVWSEKQFAQYGTLTLADGKLVVLDEDGDLVIADATPDKYTERSRATVLEGRCWSVPVLSNGRIFARNNKGKMVCLDVRR